MDIEQLIALLNSKKSELDADQEKNKKELKKINAALKALATEEGRKQQQSYFEKFEANKEAAHLNDWNELVSDYNLNQDNVEERCFYITNEGDIKKASIVNKSSRPHICEELEKCMQDGTLFFQRSLDGTSWNLYQTGNITSTIRVVDYGEMKVDMGMTGPVRIDDEEKRNTLLAEHHLGGQALAPYKTGVNYVWDKKVDVYCRKYQRIEDMLKLMNNLNGQYILDHKDEAQCLNEYAKKNPQAHIDDLNAGDGGYDEEALETLLICSNMAPEARSHQVANQDPMADVKEVLPMTEVQQKLIYDYMYGVKLNQDIYAIRNNREAICVESILEGRKTLISTLKIPDEAARTAKLGELVRNALREYAIQLRGSRITSENVYATPFVMQRILKMLDCNDALRSAVGLTNEERSYYEAAARVAQYHQDYMKMIAEAKQNGHVQKTPEFVGEMLTYQLLSQMELRNKIAQAETCPKTKIAGKDNKFARLYNMSGSLSEAKHLVPSPLIQVARHEGGLKKLVADMQIYVQKLPIYQEYLGMSENNFIDRVEFDINNAVMEEFLEHIGNERQNSTNGMADWYIDTFMGWERGKKHLKPIGDTSNTLADKVKEQHRQSVKDASRLESPKDILQLLRKNIDAAWRLAHGASLKMKWIGDYKRMHSKLKDIQGYLDDHKGNQQVDVHKLETMMNELAEAAQDYIAYKQGVGSHADISEAAPRGLGENGNKRYNAALNVLAVAQDSISKLNKVARYTDFFSSFTGEGAESFDAEKLTKVASTLYVNGSNYMLMKGWTELDELKLVEMCEEMQFYINHPNDFVLLRNKPNDPLALFTPVIMKGMRPEDIAERKKRANEFNNNRERNLKEVREEIGRNKGLDRHGITGLLSADQNLHSDSFWEAANNKYYSNLDGQREIKGLIHAILVHRGLQLTEIDNLEKRTDEKNQLMEELRQVADAMSDLTPDQRESKWSKLLQEACEGIKKLKPKPIDLNDIGLSAAYKFNQIIIQDINDVAQIIEANKGNSAWCRQMKEDGSFMKNTNVKNLVIRDRLFWRTSLPHTTNKQLDFPVGQPELMAVQNYIDKKGLKWNEELAWMQDDSIGGDDYNAMYNNIKAVDLKTQNGNPLFIKYYQKYKQESDPESKNKWNDKILYFVDKVDKKQKIGKGIRQLELSGLELDPISDHLVKVRQAYNDLRTLLEPDQSGNIRLVDETIRRNGDTGNKSEKAVAKALKSIEEHCTVIHAFVNAKIADMDPANGQTFVQLTSLRQVRDLLDEMQIIRPSKYTTLLEAVDIVRTPQSGSLYDRERLCRVCDLLNKQVPGLLEDKKVRNSLSENEKLDLLSLFAFKELLELQGGQMSDPKFQEKIFNQSWEVLKVTREYDDSEYIYGTYSSKLDKVVDEAIAHNIAKFTEMRKRLKDPNVRKSLKFNNLNNQTMKDIVTEVKTASTKRIEEAKRNMEQPMAEVGNVTNQEAKKKKKTANELR